TVATSFPLCLRMSTSVTVTAELVLPPPFTPVIDPVGAGVGPWLPPGAGLPPEPAGTAITSGWKGSLPSNAWPVSGGAVDVTVGVGDVRTTGGEFTPSMVPPPPPLRR